MISIPGHVYCEGKASDSVQARCVNLARRGVIAMTYDYIDTGERNTGANACASMPYGGGNDHGLKGFSYTSGTPTGLEILDGVRAVDYLYTRADVDTEPARLHGRIRRQQFHLLGECARRPCEAGRAGLFRHYVRLLDPE